MFSPFTCRVPVRLRDAVIDLQHRRLHDILPVMCLTLAVNAIAMALAVHGDLPLWQQILPPLLIIGVTLVVLVFVGLRPRSCDSCCAFDQLRKTTFVAAGLGLVAGLWGVNAFREDAAHIAVVAPVFIALSALVCANCLTCAPRAAIVGMIAAIGPIVAAMVACDSLAVRAMAVVLVLVTLLQSNVALARFRETVKMLSLQHELDRMATSDALTGLDNRRAFMRKLNDRLASERPVCIAIADLDGFKQANDRHGHHAGDMILLGVAQRARELAQSAVSIARLGGDEFALLYEGSTGKAQVERELEAIRAAISLPFVVEKAIIPISTCIGSARSPDDGCSVGDLMQAADTVLYREKAQRGCTADQRRTSPPPPTGSRRRWRDG